MKVDFRLSDPENWHRRGDPSSAFFEQKPGFPEAAVEPRLAISHAVRQRFRDRRGTRFFSPSHRCGYPAFCEAWSDRKRRTRAHFATGFRCVKRVKFSEKSGLQDLFRITYRVGCTWRIGPPMLLPPSIRVKSGHVDAALVAPAYPLWERSPCRRCGQIRSRATCRKSFTTRIVGFAPAWLGGLAPCSAGGVLNSSGCGHGSTRFRIRSASGRPSTKCAW